MNYKVELAREDNNGGLDWMKLAEAPSELAAIQIATTLWTFYAQHWGFGDGIRNWWINVWDDTRKIGRIAGFDLDKAKEEE